MRLLVTGASGLLGPYLVEAASHLGSVVGSGFRHGDRPCDLASRSDGRALLDDVAPDLVIHAAALTDVDACQADPVRADALNRRAVVNLVEALSEKARLILISTDQVYPDLPGPHLEGSEAPVNVYGATKLAGEQAALRHPKSLVLRVNLFGPSRTPGRASLSDFVVDNLRAGQPITVFEDVFFSPLHMATLAQIIAEAAGIGLCGTFNLGSREGLSKKDFAFAIAERLGLGRTKMRVGRSSALADRAPRAKDLRMDVTLIEKALGREMPSLLDEIETLVVA